MSNLHISFSFRHKWDKFAKSMIYDVEFKPYELGFWYRQDTLVGKKDLDKPALWGKNTVKQHTIGIKLLVCKAWINIDFGAARFNTEK